MFTTPVRLFDMKLLSSHALWKFLVPVISLFECVVHVHENQCYKVGCSVKACLLAGMLTSSSVQVCCWFAYIQWTIDDLLIFWILNALLREKGMHSIQPLRCLWQFIIGCFLVCVYSKPFPWKSLVFMHHLLWTLHDAQLLHDSPEACFLQ